MSAPFILQPAPVVLLKTQLDNSIVQGITAGNEINLFTATGRPFAILGAALYYTDATLFFSTDIGISAWLNYRSGGDVAAIYQDTLSGTGFIKIEPNNAVSLLPAYDPSAPNFSPQYSDSEINLVFDGNYNSGDGVLNVYVWGWYLYA